MKPKAFDIALPPRAKDEFYTPKCNDQSSTAFVLAKDQLTEIGRSIGRDSANQSRLNPSEFMPQMLLECQSGTESMKA